MRRWLVSKLNDVLTEIRLHSLNAGRCKRIIQANLLGNHGFGFCHQIRTMLLGNLNDDAAGLRTIRGAVNMNSIFTESFGKSLQVGGQIGNRLTPNCFRAITEFS